MINSIKLLCLLILLTNIYIQANIIDESQALTNGFEYRNADQEKITNEKIAVNSIAESQLLRMIRKLRKDEKIINHKCAIKMVVCILRVPTRPPK
jgi:hypothetical protein